MVAVAAKAKSRQNAKRKRNVRDAKTAAAKPSKAAAANTETLHAFDREHGTETGRLILGHNLWSGQKHDRHITAYHGTAPSVFSQMMALWLGTRPPHALREYSFLDIGAGKGRAMLLASEFAFHQIIGVEMNPELAAIARSNLEIWQKKRDALNQQILKNGQLLSGPGRRIAVKPSQRIRLLEVDATELEYPDGPCLVYLFNPFREVVMRRLLRNLERQFARRPGELDILYVNHECRDVLKAHAGFSELWSGSVPLTAEDAAADHATIVRDAKDLFESTDDEVCSIWRLRALFAK